MLKKTVLYALVGLIFSVAAAAGENSRENIRWSDFRQGTAQSKLTGKVMVIYFYSKTCPSCAEMEKTTWRDARVVAALNTRYTPIKVDVDAERQIAGMYKVYYLPTTWFVKPDGKPFGSRSGYIPANLLLKIFANLPK